MSAVEKLTFKTPLWKHQAEGLRRADDAGSFAFLWEVGTGKTRAAIETCRAHWARGLFAFKSRPKILVLTPLITLENWKRELAEHMPEHRGICVLQGSQLKRRDIFRFASEKGVHVFITNPEALLMEELVGMLEKWAPDILIIDECHRFKNHTAKRSKVAARLARASSRRLLLTGTPITKDPMDVFAQWLLLDGGETFGTNFFGFRAKYFWDKNAGMPKQAYFPAWVPKPGAFEALSAKLGKYSMRVKKSECLDLPPLVKKQVFVPLSPVQERLYNDMKRDFIALVTQTEAAVATLAITKALRLMQIASGFVQTEDLSGESTARKQRSIEGNPRAEALRELLAELCPDHKVIVWAVFKENYEAIRGVCDALGVKYVEVHGEIPNARKFENVDAFNKDPSVRVLIGHPRSGGIGINLVASDVSVVYSRTFSLEDDIQSEARNYRGGSEIHEKVTRIDLVAAGTIDEEIAARLAQKQAVSEAVLRDIARVL